MTEPAKAKTPASSPGDAGGEREIDEIYSAPEVHWVGDGFRVAGYFSIIPDAARRLSPFLLLDYHLPYTYPPTHGKRGVGPHPHRGFETVTISWAGSVAHQDSAGNGGVIGPGDVQWMTAASGVLHREYHEAEFARRGGPFHVAQIWVNLPKAHKMDPPRYQALPASGMGRAVLPGGAGEVRVIAGEYGGVRGPAKTFTRVQLLDVYLNRGGSVGFSIPATDTAAVLVMEGDVRINRKEDATANDFVLFKNRGERITIDAQGESASTAAGNGAGAAAHLLVMSGEPIDEPVFQYGPFVMNEEREIRQAIADFNTGKFGSLED